MERPDRRRFDVRDYLLLRQVNIHSHIRNIQLAFRPGPMLAYLGRSRLHRR